MTRFSANLGFLWKELALPEAILAAARHGFDAVECHWPYQTPSQTVAETLAATGLKMMSLNVTRGNASDGDFGLGAIPGREEECREGILEAINYASAIGCSNVHLLAGVTEDPNAEETFLRNLSFAAEAAALHEINILIEPINTHDVPGYHLTTTKQALRIIDQIGDGNLRMMFDCYHVRMMEGDPGPRFRECLHAIGHIQIAAWPGRGRPDKGELDYRPLLTLFAETGWDQPLGAEYVPEGNTQDSLDWLSFFRRI